MTEGHYIHVKRENFPEHVAGDCLNHTCTEDSICIPGNCSAVFKGFKDCSEILSTDSSRKGQDGVYVIYIDDTWREVFCDMTTDGGGWTIIQKREDGDVDFYRTWKEYKEGFGNASKNYWIGNQAIHALTKDKNQELRIDFQRHNGEQASAVYTTFYIGDEDSKYTLTVSGYNGTAGDSLSWHNGMRFSTKDQENDIDSSRNCATTFHGAWWYRYCFQSNLNREYAQSAANDPRYATRWHFKRSHEALQKTVMMIRQN
ncbi:ficolin-1-like [Saccostrea echinata]|uniref:ficolin-1-like n=1 Tax=Saccostrea echinata TaxID=191078 RepID=UPI002A7F35E3|nr:ficolin-1-like [Saccostrea echinata]